MNTQENPNRENLEPEGRPEHSSAEPPPQTQARSGAAIRQGINQTNRRSPALAAILSLMPGMGQIYVGYYQTGFVYMVVVALTITVLNLEIEALAPLLGFSVSFFWIYNMIDAYRRARHYNLALSGEAEIQLPEGFKFSTQGSLWGGLALIVTGFLIFLNTKFDVSMDWIEEWWPLLVIAVGVYLLTKHVRSKPE